MIILQLRPLQPVRWRRHPHCETCDVLSDLLDEWTKADPAGLGWWQWRTGVAATPLRKGR